MSTRTTSLSLQWNVTILWSLVLVNNTQSPLLLKVSWFLSNTKCTDWCVLPFFPAPSGPPVGVVASINSLSSIAVSWSPPVGGADGYVILYSTEGSSNMTQLVEGEDQTSSLLTGLSEGQLYTIRVFAYKDLYSQPSQSVNVAIVPGAYLSLCSFDVTMHVYNHIHLSSLSSRSFAGWFCSGRYQCDSCCYF